MRKRLWGVAAVILFLLFQAGCISKTVKTEKIRDLEFTVMDKEKIPEELKTVIESTKKEPFRVTYFDQGELYIAEGYGPQGKTGYSVEVTGLYETESAVYIHTSLLGPEKGEKTKDIVTYPYVVVKLNYIEKKVVFE